MASKQARQKKPETIKREIRYLRKFIDTADESEATAKRVAWSVEQALRRTIETVRGWPSLVEDCRGTAALIEQDIANRK